MTALLGLRGALGVSRAVASRCLSRDIGQPTHYSHPELLAKDEGKIIVRN